MVLFELLLDRVRVEFRVRFVGQFARCELLRVALVAISAPEASRVSSSDTFTWSS